MKDSMLNLKTGEKLNRYIMSLLLVTIPNTMMWTGCLVFINMNINLSSDWHSNTFKSPYWSFWHECQICHSQISKEMNSIWYCFPHRYCPTNFSLLYSRQKPKQIKHIHETNNSKWQQFPPRTFFMGVWINICIYIYIYIYIERERFTCKYIHTQESKERR